MVDPAPTSMRPHKAHNESDFCVPGWGRLDLRPQQGSATRTPKYSNYFENNESLTRARVSGLPQTHTLKSELP